MALINSLFTILEPPNPIALHPRSRNLFYTSYRVMPGLDALRQRKVGNFPLFYDQTPVSAYRRYYTTKTLALQIQPLRFQAANKTLSTPGAAARSKAISPSSSGKVS